MSDLEDILNRKTSPLESSSKHTTCPPLSTNGNLKVTKNNYELESDLILLNNDNHSTNVRSEQSDTNSEVIFDPLLEMSSDTYLSQINKSMDNNVRTSALPRPPSKSSIQQIARHHNLQQKETNHFQHHPLTRAIEPNIKGDSDFSYENNPFSQKSNESRNTISDYAASHKVVNRNPDVNKTNNVKTRQLYSKSSENLLEEYGLDFSKLSMASGSRSVKESVTYNNNSQYYPAVPQSHNHNQQTGNNMDIFADLDPLGKKSGDNHFKPVPPPRPSQPPSILPAQTLNNVSANQVVDLLPFDLYRTDSIKSSIDAASRHETTLSEQISSHQPPIVPPRNRKSSQTTNRQNQSNWTTFE